MKYRVYDDAKNILAEFETEARARQYAENNDDLVAYINDERVVEVKQRPIAAAPVLPVPKPEPKLLDAAAALTRIKALQADTVNQIIEQVIAGHGYCIFDEQHPLIIKRLQELGFSTEEAAGTVTVTIKEAL